MFRNLTLPVNTTEEYYNFTNANRGIALIFNHIKIAGFDKERFGTQKDGNDLKAVLKGLQFDVRYHPDFKLDKIRNELTKGKTL